MYWDLHLANAAVCKPCFSFAQHIKIVKINKNVRLSGFEAPPHSILSARYNYIWTVWYKKYHKIWPMPL